MKNETGRILRVQGKHVLVFSGPVSCGICDHVGGRHRSKCQLFGKTQLEGPEGPERVLACYQAEAIAREIPMEALTSPSGEP